MKEVRSVTSTPAAAAFTGKDGTPIIVDRTNLKAYALSSAGVVFELGLATATGIIDDTPANGVVDHSISSNWAFDHVAAADPHTGYRLESADHTHQSTGAQAGQLDHGLAMTGLTDDDHTQYLLASQATDRATFTTNWGDLTDGGGTTLHTHASTGITDFTEAAQDAVGAMVDASLTYVDATPLLQRAALTGDVTASAGSNSTTIANDAVTFVKLQNIATDSLIGRDSALTGDPENILLNATLSMDGAGNLQRAALTGAITASAGSNTTALGSFTKAELDGAVSDGNVLYVGDVTQYTDEMAQDAVGGMVADTTTIDLTYTDATPELKADVKTNSISDSLIRQSAGVSVIGRSAGTVGNVADITAGADDRVLRRSGGALDFGLLTDGMVSTNTFSVTRLAFTATDRLAGRSTAGAGAGEEIVCTAFARSILDDANEATFKATVNLEIGVDVQAYDADLTTWAGVTPGTGVATALAVNVGTAGAVLVNGGVLGTPSSGTLTNATGLPPGGLTFAATQRVAARNSALGGVGEEATASQVLDWLGSTRGQILYRGGANWDPLSPGAAGKFLRTAGAGADPTWELVDVSSSSQITGTLAIGNGGTGQTTASAAFGALKQAASDTATGVLEIADQSEMEAATDTGRAVVPGRVQYHPGVAKAWLKCDAAGTIQVSHNVTSITDTGTGLLSVTWATDFSSADYVVQATALSGNQNFVSANTMAAGTCAFICWRSDTAALADPTNYLISAYGDQA